MPTSRSQTAKHSKRDLDIALRRKPDTTSETVSPPELTVPGTQARHFRIIQIKHESMHAMSEKLTNEIAYLAKTKKAIVAIVGCCQDDHCITYTVEWWTY